MQNISNPNLSDPRRRTATPMKFWDGKINPFIKTLIYSEFLITGSFGLFGPIIAIFITKQITGGTILTVGIAHALYLITKSLLQIPTGKYIDRKKGEKDDFRFLFGGSLALSSVPILFAFSSLPIHIYIIQLWCGIGSAFAYPSWNALFTKHIDKKHEGYEWGIYNTSVGLGAAGAAAIGAWLVKQFGFTNIFILVGILSFIGSFVLLFLRKYLKI